MPKSVEGLPEIGPVGDVEIRRMNIWMSRILKPHAAASTMESLQKELSLAQKAFSATLEGVAGKENALAA